MKKQPVILDRVTLSRAVTHVAVGGEEGRRLLATMAPVLPRIIGWTGPPGAGKSSLISAVVEARRLLQPERIIAILALDPSSASTGGSVLGDRIRMESLALDQGVFIRSFSSSGSGEADLAPVLRVARFLAAQGFDEIHIETVGAGQNDVAIASVVGTFIVVVSPHAGDAIQGLKAGLLESADLFVVNKSDIAGADAAAVGLEIAVTPRRGGWEPPVLLVSARTGDGLDRLSGLIDDHIAAMETSGEAAHTATSMRSSEFRATVRSEVWRALRQSEAFAEMEARVAAGEIDPSEAAAAIVAKVARASG